MNNFKFGRRSTLRLRTVNPMLAKLAEKALKLSKVDFGIPSHGGRRTADEQEALYKKEASKADGYSSLSYHQSGDALDFYAYVDGKATWDLEELSKVVVAFEGALATLPMIVQEYILEFGMDWNNQWDAGHLQIKRIIFQG